MNTLNLQSVVEQYTSPTDLTENAKVALRNKLLDYKSHLDARRQYLYSQLRPGQEDTKTTIDSLYIAALKDFAKEHDLVENLFPILDMSFLTEPTGNFPRWALYDANKIEPFKIRYATFLEGRDHRTNHTDQAISLSSDSAFVSPSKFGDLFQKSRFNASYDDGLYKSLGNHVLYEYLNFDGLRLTPEMRATTWAGIRDRLLIIPQQSELSAGVERWFRYNRTIEIKLEFSAKFEHFVPESVNKTIADFGAFFDELIFIAEVPDWQPSKAELVPAGDPLLVGRRGKEYRLLDAFDLTDAEAFIKQEFTL